MFSQLVKQSPWWAAGNCSHAQFISSPGVKCITQNKIPNRSYQTMISNGTAFLSLTPEQNQKKPNYIEKKKQMLRLSHPWESKKAGKSDER